MNQAKEYIIKHKVDILFVITVILMSLFFFKDLFEYGMEYDEVYRFNNIFQHFNKNAESYVQYISSISIGEITIPLMLKEYISYMLILPYLPIGWFGEPFITVRCLYYLYNVGVIIIIYFFLKKYSHNFALLTGLLLITCPILYPDANYGWVVLLSGIAILIFVHCLEKFNESSNMKWLFIGTFSMAFYANINFYFMWVIFGICFACLILYPKATIKRVFKIKNFICIVVGVLLGLFNYILYNILDGFPTLRVLWQYIFDTDKYNANAIDGKKTVSLFDSWSIKINSYLECIGETWGLYVVAIVLFCTVNFYMMFFYYKKGEWNTKKKIFLPFLTSIIGFFAMLVSPNSQGSHHLCLFIVPLCVSAVSTFYMIGELLNNRKVVTIIGVFFVVLGAGQSCYSTIQYGRECGSGYFSNKVFDLIEYAEENDFADEEIQFLEWGLTTQFYFFNEGEFKVNDITYQIIDASEDELEEYYEWYTKKYRGETLYAPIYISEVQENIGAIRNETKLEINDKTGKSNKTVVSEEVCIYIKKMQEYGATCTLEKVFYEESGKPAMAWVKIEDIGKNWYHITENRDACKISNEEDSRNDLENLLIGGYVETNQIWASNDLKFALWNDLNCEEVVFDIYIPLEMYMREGINELEIEVYINDKCVDRFMYTESGVYEIRVPKGVTTEWIDVHMKSSSAIQPEGDERSLSYIVDLIYQE